MALLTAAPIAPSLVDPIPAPARRRTRRQDAFAIATAALVNERAFDPRFSFTALAKELRASTFLLRGRFRRFYGISLDEHLASRRLELATLLMSGAPHRIGGLDDIARACGYRDAAALDRDFLRYRSTPALAAWFRMPHNRAAVSTGAVR
jgi:transcriptional regulator GlxA family with amidase domain